MTQNETVRNIDRLLDVEINVTVRFGKTEIPLRELVRFGVGSMIELNRSVDEPVDLVVNNYPFARGEVVVIDGYYGVRITETGTPVIRSVSTMSFSPACTTACLYTWLARHSGVAMNRVPSCTAT